MLGKYFLVINAKFTKIWRGLKDMLCLRSNIFMALSLWHCKLTCFSSWFICLWPFPTGELKSYPPILRLAKIFNGRKWAAPIVNSYPTLVPLLWHIPKWCYVDFACVALDNQSNWLISLALYTLFHRSPVSKKNICQLQSVQKWSRFSCRTDHQI